MKAGDVQKYIIKLLKNKGNFQNITDILKLYFGYIFIYLWLYIGYILRGAKACIYLFTLVILSVILYEIWFRF